MGVMPDFPPPPAGCKGKIDFLFLISRTGTMGTEQDKLLPSLPGFLATIEATFPDFDTHIMVANPDGTWPGWGCEVPELCGTKPYTCGPNAPGLQVRPRDMGSHQAVRRDPRRRHPLQRGPDATNHPCELAEGRRYMVVPGEPEPATAFDCIARVGTYGGPDRRWARRSSPRSRPRSTRTTAATPGSCGRTRSSSSR
jgi:hypothetical protein